jgi:hypothetical protein
MGTQIFFNLSQGLAKDDWLTGGALFNRASYNIKLGGANRDRTDDLYNAIVALSQLSYSPLLRRRTLTVHCIRVNQCQFDFAVAFKFCSGS